MDIGNNDKHITSAMTAAVYTNRDTILRWFRTG